MKKNTYKILSNIPIVGVVIKVMLDPMIGGSQSLNDGLPKAVRDYSLVHKDIFVTKKLFSELIRDRKK